MKGARGWDRKLWGVVMMPTLAADRPFLIGDRWHCHTRPPRYEGEPYGHALTFQTRKAARAWVNGWRGRWGHDRMRVVRVHEKTTVL